MKKYSFLGFILIIQFLLFALFNGFGILSTDDIGTVHTTSLEFSKVWNRAIEFEQQAPMYFLMMNIWRSVSDSLLWAKLFNYLVFALSTIYFYKIIGYNIPEKKSRYLVLIFFALHPFVFFISNDLRRYSLTLLFGLITLYYTIHIYLGDSHKKSNHILLIFFAALGILNDYFHAFLLAAMGFALLFIRGKKKWWYYLEMTIPFVVFLFMLKYILFQLESTDQWSIEHMDDGVFYASLKHLVYLIESQTYAIPFTNMDSILKMLFRIIFVLPLVYFWGKKLSIKQDFSEKNLFLYGSALFFVVVYLAVVNLLNSNDYMLLRYTGFSFPVLFLSFSIIIVWFIKRFNKVYIKTIALSLLIIIYIMSYQRIYLSKVISFRNHKQTSTWVSTIEDTPVFVLNSKYAAMINYYLNNIDKAVIAIPEKMSFDVYDFNARSIISHEQLDSLFRNRLQDESEFYILISFGDAQEKNHNAHLLYSYLDKNFYQLSEERKTGFYRLKYTAYSYSHSH